MLGGFVRSPCLRSGGVVKNGMMDKDPSSGKINKDPVPLSLSGASIIIKPPPHPPTHRRAVAPPTVIQAHTHPWVDATMGKSTKHEQQPVEAGARSVAGKPLPPLPTDWTDSGISQILFYQYVEPVWSARRQKQALAAWQHGIHGSSLLQLDLRSFVAVCRRLMPFVAV